MDDRLFSDSPCIQAVDRREDVPDVGRCLVGRSRSWFVVGAVEALASGVDVLDALLLTGSDVVVNPDDRLQNVIVPLSDLGGRAGNVIAGHHTDTLSGVDLDGGEVVVVAPRVLVELPGGLLDALGELAAIDGVGPAAGLRDVGVGQSEMLQDRDKRRVHVAGLGVAHIVAVDVGERILGLLEKGPAVETGIDLGHRDALAVQVVALVAPLIPCVAVTGCCSVVAVLATLCGSVAIGPGCKRFLLLVAHPLLAFEQRRWVNVGLGVGPVGTGPTVPFGVYLRPLLRPSQTVPGIFT
ncbi:hypothetical protein ACFQL1_15785 [Halomicroarcula sp. GCM10025709]|uniref:hypothetical protein n=1 Tax=Halomicroarcula sp. GCM10025709 TaxID=3252669 RepID=UPI00361775D9